MYRGWRHAKSSGPSNHHIERAIRVAAAAEPYASEPLCAFTMRSTAALRMFQPTTRMMFRPSARAMRPVPKEDQAGHTISQRLRKIKQIPAELWPLAIVVGFAVVAAGYSVMRKFVVDKNLRLSRQGAAGRSEH